MKAGRGYMEDRRPAANCDPYRVPSPHLGGYRQDGLPSLDVKVHVGWLLGNFDVP